MVSKIFIPLLVIFLLSSCFLSDDRVIPSSPATTSDRINLPAGKLSSSTNWTLCGDIELDLTGYDQIDSIIFRPNLRSQLNEKTCIAELYDFNQKRSVLGSLVQSKENYVLHHVSSLNLLNSLPKDKVRVGIRFRSSDTGHHVEVGIGSHIRVYYQ